MNAINREKLGRFSTKNSTKNSENLGTGANVTEIFRFQNIINEIVSGGANGKEIFPNFKLGLPHEVVFKFWKIPFFIIQLSFVEYK